MEISVFHVHETAAKKKSNLIKHHSETETNNAKVEHNEHVDWFLFRVKFFMWLSLSPSKVNCCFFFSSPQRAQKMLDLDEATVE